MDQFDVTLRLLRTAKISVFRLELPARFGARPLPVVGPQLFHTPSPFLIVEDALFDGPWPRRGATPLLFPRCTACGKLLVTGALDEVE